jgi:methionyl aminopeptidase
MIGRNDDCWCGSGKKWKKCHFPKLSLKEEYFRDYGILLKNEEQIDKIRASCRLASHILEETCKMAKEGISTQQLNDFAHQLHLQAGAIPAPLHYGSPPFPKSICTSLNEVICHGIPNDKPLEKGDILNIDVTCVLDGFYGDCSKMVVIGETTSERKLVTEVAYECLMRAVQILRPGIPVSAIGDVIEDYATSQKCSVVHQFVGHGVGIHFHEGPQISHHRNEMDVLLVPGMTFTIEPMINAGVAEAVVDKKDHWTARTKDGKASAQWEHTVLITSEGHEVLTNWSK